MSESIPDLGTKVCPRCAEEVKSVARACRYCGHEFEQAPGGSEPLRAATSPSSPPSTAASAGSRGVARTQERAATRPRRGSGQPILVRAAVVLPANACVNDSVAILNRPEVGARRLPRAVARWAWTKSLGEATRALAATSAVLLVLGGCSSATSAPAGTPSGCQPGAMYATQAEAEHCAESLGLSASAVAPATPATPAPPASAVQSEPVTLLRHSGNGMWTSKPFNTQGASVDMAYTYDCSAIGQAGVFTVMLYGKDGVVGGLANEQGTKVTDQSTSAYFNGAAGPFHIAVISECAWTISITGAP